MRRVSRRDVRAASRQTFGDQAIIGQSHWAIVKPFMREVHAGMKPRAMRQTSCGRGRERYPLGTPGHFAALPEGRAAA